MLDVCGGSFNVVSCSFETQDDAWKSGGAPDLFARGTELKGVVSESFCQVQNLSNNDLAISTITIGIDFGGQPEHVLPQ